MNASKRGHAVTGGLFTIEHAALQLDGLPFTSHVDVLFDGVTHQVLSASSNKGFSYENTTAAFAVGPYQGHIVESMDTVETQVVHRHQAILDTPHGALSVHGYDGPERLLELVGALRPQATRLGVTIAPDAGAEIRGPAKVALASPIGLFEITPLTSETDAILPTWRGTAVDHGDLYGGRLTDEAPFLVLVTDSARVMLLPGAEVDADDVTPVMAGLSVSWHQ